MIKKLGTTKKLKIKDYRAIIGQVNKNEPTSAFISLPCWIYPAGQDLNKLMTRIERKFRIYSNDIIIDEFKALNMPLGILKDVQWSDSHKMDLDDQISYVLFEVTILWCKSNKIKISDKRLARVTDKLVEWVDEQGFFFPNKN